MLDPLVLIKLRATGSCDFEISEALYDTDHAGQYFRRIKSVSVSLPCIAGPYTSVSAKLSLGANSYRKSKVITPNYQKTPGTDERFVDNINAAQSIATNNAQNDSGVFELNFRDERYLPFEGTGAISSWKLELPSELRQFDYDTISDVIIHVKYTAKEGGELLKSSVIDELKKIKEGLSQEKFHVAINMKHDLPNEWHILKHDGVIDLIIDKSRLPYMVQSIDAAPEIESVMLIAKVVGNPSSFTVNVIDNVNVTHSTNLSRIDDWKLCRGLSTDIKIGTLFSLSLAAVDKINLEELMLIVKYKFA